MCLAHALIIAMAKVNWYPKYKSYRVGYSLKQPVQDQISGSGIDLTNGGGFKILEQFQDYLSNYKINVYDGLRPDRILFNGKLYLLYDPGNYNIIRKIKFAMAKRYVCNAYDTLYDVTDKCHKACSLCTAIQPCF